MPGSSHTIVALLWCMGDISPLTPQTGGNSAQLAHVMTLMSGSLVLHVLQTYCVSIIQSMGRDADNDPGATPIMAGYW